MASRTVVLLSLALTAPALACAGSVAPAPPVAVGATRAPVAQSAHGQIKLLGEALGDVPLTDGQRAPIEQLAAEADARHEQGRAARRELLQAIASQVEAGVIDRAVLQPKIDAVVAGLQASQPADRAAFEKLHSILGPDQRVAFVDALEARISQRADRAREKLGMREWADLLKLSDAQRDQIKAVLRDGIAEWRHHDHDGAPWAEGRRRGAKLLEAFKGDRFVFDELAPRRDAARGAGDMADRFLSVAARVLPVLTPDQRALAAQKLRERADAPDLEHLP
jgi:Spy/CpxP family protein refolding chaperone